MARRFDLSRRSLASGLGLVLALGVGMVALDGLELAGSQAPGEAHAAPPPSPASPSPAATAKQDPGAAPLVDPAVDPEAFAALPLAERIDTLIAIAALGPETRLGVSIVDLASGETLYDRDAAIPLNPASNVKLVTTAAALSRLGPEHRYATRVWAGLDTVEDGVVAGPLYLQGGGDPSLVTGEIYELAGQLRSAGVTKIRGPIIVDASRFDGDGLPPGFEQKDEFASHRAPYGAMSVNYNTYEVHARPAKVLGESPKLLVEPPIASIELVSEAKTVAGNRNKLWVSTEDKGGKTIVTFHGEVGVDNGPSSYRYPIRDPSRYAGELLALALSQRGIKLSKDQVETGEVPKDAELLATFRSESLSELCRGVNKWSNNFMAEQILRTMASGKRATAAASLEILRAWTVEIGMPQDGLVLGNGSGLYDNNRISPAALTHLLAWVYADFRIRSDYLASLAIMGGDGTTRSRLQDSPAEGWVRVKTGTLDDVSALSGYAGAHGRDPIAFAIVINGLERKDRSKARDLQDGIAEQLAIEAQRADRE